MSDGERQQTPPRVFISYAQYEPAHSDRVLALAHALAADGLDVELDQFHGHETVDWPRWCEERLRPENTDFVLMVCSAEYRRRIEGRVAIDQGRGVFWEGNLIYGYLYREKANERFVPLLLDEEPKDSLPPAVANWNHFRLRDFGLQRADQGYEDLYRLLTGQAATPKPDRGELVRLPPRPVPEIRSTKPISVPAWQGRVSGADTARSWFWVRWRESLAATVFARRNTRRYLRNLVAEHRAFTFLGRAKPLELENIYVSLKVGEHTPRALKPDGPAVEEPDVPVITGRTVEVSEALSLSRRLVVLGDPGAGKTTLLKYLMLQLAQRDVRIDAFARVLIPTHATRILEPLRRFLSGANFFFPGVILSFIALLFWMVQAIPHGMLIHAYGVLILFSFSLSLYQFVKRWRGATTVIGAFLLLGLVAYIWYEWHHVGPVAVWLMGIGVGLLLYPYWIQPLLALLRALLRRATRYPLPVYLTLNNIMGDARPLEDHLAEAVADAGFSNPQAFLRHKLLRGECMLLLDALDEVIETGVQQRVVSEINRLRHSYGAGNQVVVTSRIAGFRYSLDGYLQLEVQEFNQTQVERFVHSWFADTEDPGEQARRIEGLLRGLDRSPRMRLLASNPLLLSLMTLLYENNWRLPERRVELYEQCAALLIEKWDQIRNITRASRFTPKQKRRTLVGVAVHFHEAGTRVFEGHALLAALKAVLPRDNGADVSSIEFLDELMAHTGLLRQKSRSTYDFVHLTFQEYFTACAYRESGDTEALLGHCGEAWWREVIRLYAALEHDATALLGMLAKDDVILAAECLADCLAVDAPMFQQTAEAIVEDLQRLVRKDADRRQEAADTLAEIGGWGSVEYLRAAVTEREHHPERALAALLALARVADQGLLDTLVAELGTTLRFLHSQLPVADLSLRPRILSLLARLGHPLVFVPAGEFLMGDDKGRADQRPRHAVTLGEYWIDKYPVTNEQYARFIQETGRDKRGWRKKFAPGKDRHPVVNVNWDDARQYSEWCGKRLPSEAEWEKAARGTDGRIYPWGNEWDGNKCNVSGRGTTPVECYVQGISPYGCHDMSGNVQEWVADWYAENYYANSPASNPQGPENGETRVFRGGSWVGDRSLVRVTCRTGSAQKDRSDAAQGFRMLCAPQPLTTEPLVTGH